MIRKPMLAALLLALPLPVASAAAQSPEIPATTTTAFERRAAQLVDLFNGKAAFADYFAPTFRAAIPEAQFKAFATGVVAQYGRAIAVEGKTATDARSGTILLRFEKGVGTILIEVSPTADQRVTGLRVTGFTMADDSDGKVAAEIAALPGQTGFLVAELGKTGTHPRASANADRQFAVGSTFKLYILDELAAQIAAGKHQWSDVVPLSHLSFSSAGTANWRRDTPVTLQSLANWMISVSDNSAADTLIHVLGREAIEARMRATVHGDPSRNIPFLTTVEAFALKGNNFAPERAAFLASDNDAQRLLLALNGHRLTLDNVDGVSFAGQPRFIDSLEWFASPNDIARLMLSLRDRESEPLMTALAINPGVHPGAAQDWDWLGYKGGSELGVISMSLLGQRKSDGKWIVVTASWNNPDAPTDTDTLVGLVTRLLALAAK